MQSMPDQGRLIREARSETTLETTLAALFFLRSSHTRPSSSVFQIKSPVIPIMKRGRAPFSRLTADFSAVSLVACWLQRNATIGSENPNMFSPHLSRYMRRTGPNSERCLQRRVISGQANSTIFGIGVHPRSQFLIVAR